MQQSILVLGADEFVGRNLIRALTASGREVRRADPAGMRTALDGVSGVINAVSASPAKIRATATALYEAAAQSATPPRIVHISSMAVYGDVTGRIAESAPLRADLGEYAAAHIAAEALADAYPVSVVFRPGCEFGADSDYWGARTARLLCTGRLGDLGPAGDGHCNLVDIDDVANAVLAALAAPHVPKGAFNLSNPQSASWNEVLTRFAIALRAVPVRRIGPRRLKIESKLLAPPFKVAEIIAGRLGVGRTLVPVPVPGSLVRLMRQGIQLDAGRAERELGIRWKGVDATLQDTARWFLGR
jgi:nucleoside-diphosphate-sugar epimerase